MHLVFPPERLFPPVFLRSSWSMAASVLHARDRPPPWQPRTHGSKYFSKTLSFFHYCLRPAHASIQPLHSKKVRSSSRSESDRCEPSLLSFLFLASRRAHIELTPVRTDATDALILFPTRILFRESAKGPRTLFSFTGRKQLTALSGGRFPHTTYIYIHSAQSTPAADDVSCIARCMRSSLFTTCKPAVLAAVFTLIL